jgi:hypothetical protein
MAAVVRNRFYVIIAIVLSALVFAGFARTFYLRAWFAVPPITTLLHLHSVAFTAWFVLFIIQTRLIAAQNYRTHMRFGVAGIALAVIVAALGYATAIMSADAPRERATGMNSQQFVFVPLFVITSFAVFVALAISFRRRAEFHKRFMILAMISVLGPPVARLIAVTQNGAYFVAIQTCVVAALLLWCLLNDWAKHRIVHPVYAIGGGILLISMPLRFLIARTPGWERVGQWLAGM